jgi:hypothetical protein
MFLFASHTSSVSPHRTGRGAIVGRFPGELREVRANGAILLWTKDWFTVVERGSGEIGERRSSANRYILGFIRVTVAAARTQSRL